MTPEQILQINEEMAKICGREYIKEDWGIFVMEYPDFLNEDQRVLFSPNTDWNDLIEVYNACLKLIESLDKNFAWVNAKSTTEDQKALAALRSFLLSNEYYYAVITDSYKKLAEFIIWYNKLPNE